MKVMMENFGSFIEICRGDFFNEMEKIDGSLTGLASPPMIRAVTSIIRTLRVLDTRLDTLETYVKEEENAKAKAKNIFHDTTSVSETITQAVGAGSMAWVGGTGSLEFDSEQAKKISEHAIERVRQLQGKK